MPLATGVLTTQQLALKGEVPFAVVGAREHRRECWAVKQGCLGFGKGVLTVAPSPSRQAVSLQLLQPQGCGLILAIFLHRWLSPRVSRHLFTQMSFLNLNFMVPHAPWAKEPPS